MVICVLRSGLIPSLFLFFKLFSPGFLHFGSFQFFKNPVCRENKRAFKHIFVHLSRWQEFLTFIFGMHLLIKPKS